MKFPVRIITKKIPHNSPNVTVYFPAVTNLNNLDAQAKINHAIITLLNEILIEQSYYKPQLVEMLAYYEIKNNQRGILSLNLIVYSFTGGAHGMTIIKSLTFDTATGKQYTLNDLFKDDSDYVKQLSAIIKVDIRNGTFNCWTNLKPFVRTKISILQIHPLSFTFSYTRLHLITGVFLYFPIPILDVADIRKPNSPLDTMMAFT